MSKRFDYRDVSVLLQALRNFLLGRKHNLHPRFPMNVAPRSIPTPDIPRGPEYKYSNQYYTDRNAFNSVKPPVVAPVAQGPPVQRDPYKKTTVGGIKPESVCFNGLPRPGPSWGWDGHSYFECVPDVPDRRPPCPPPPPPPKPKPCAPPPPKSCKPPEPKKCEPPATKKCEPSPPKPCPPPPSKPCGKK